MKSIEWYEGNCDPHHYPEHPVMVDANERLKVYSVNWLHNGQRDVLLFARDMYERFDVFNGLPTVNNEPVDIKNEDGDIGQCYVSLPTDRAVELYKKGLTAQFNDYLDTTLREDLHTSFGHNFTKAFSDSLYESVKCFCVEATIDKYCEYATVIQKALDAEQSHR